MGLLAAAAAGPAAQAGSSRPASGRQQRAGQRRLCSTSSTAGTRWIGRPSQPRRVSPAATSAIAVPGPLFISQNFDRDRLKDSKTSLQSGGSNFLQFPMREDASELRRTPPLVRVRLAVEYRVHSRQMLCVGGSQIPFGWSFLSIAKVPATWNPGDLWSVEVELPAGTKVEYKYVILEEQDWTQQVNELSEGKVEYTYRIEPETSPPDVQKITKQMAIVAWQPGPNRLLQVPSEDELAQLSPGVRIERVAPLPPQQSSQRSYGQQAMGGLTGRELSGGGGGGSGGGGSSSSGGTREELAGIWEVLSLDDEGRPFLDRRDVWGREDQPLRSVRRPLFGR